MAQNIRLRAVTPTGSIQINGAVNAHSSGDICYEQGYYGVALDDVAAGGSFRLSIDCVAYVAIPGGTLAGARLGSASKPAGAITLAAAPAVPLGICKTPPDATGYGEFHFFPAMSAGL